MDYKNKYEEAMLRMSKWAEGSEIVDPKEVAEFVFPELKESEDERIRKEILEYFHQFENEELHRINISDWITWLEKQGEQKPADKVESKFKVGDWIVEPLKDKPDYLWYIDRIKDDCYWYDAISAGVKIAYANQECHLWTIQDAKDGDVLAFDDAFILIFKGITDLKLDPPLFKKVRGFYFRSYVNVDFLMNVFEQGSFCCDIGHSCHPATKEQRDLLFQKMKEAGYDWDAEKKELKKIEQKSTWSEEDED